MNIIEQILRENIFSKEVYFVFPTQLNASMWADRSTQITDAKAVAKERFIAWDTFKQESIKSTNKDKTAIPSTLRDFFACQLIEQNKTENFLSGIIPREFAQKAGNFSSYLSSILPSINLWKKYSEASGVPFDEEDESLDKIHKKYSDFLESHSLFDPAWETPPFNSDGKFFIVFFPEILSDYIEYKEILEKTSDQVKLIHVSDIEETPDFTDKVVMFKNSRQEIKNVALHLHFLHQKGIEWNKMALCVPDMDSYGEYIFRDLKIHSIPFVSRFATPLGSTGAGSFFKECLDCKINEFSFDSMTKLLLNSNLPWESQETVNQLVEFGQKNHCICNYTYKGSKVNVWNNSFNSFENAQKENRAKAFYNSLVEHITKLNDSDSFEKIRRHYFEFRTKFFDMTKCSEKNDLILSRAVTELGQLIDLEQSFPDVEVTDHFKFFADYLNGIKYLAQTEQRGVSVIPYRLSACSPFEAQVILDSSQTGISVSYKKLPFLIESKRKKLFGADGEDSESLMESNVTESFIQLYKMNSTREKTLFTASEKTFSGYEQSSSYLNEVEFDEIEGKNDFERIEDLFLSEKESFLQEEQGLSEQFQVQNDGLKYWLETKYHATPQNQPMKLSFENLLRNGRYRISQGDLKSFYDCPRKFVLTKAQKIGETSIEAQIASPFDIGNLNHEILERFLSELREKKLCLALENEALSEEYQEILDKAIVESINDNYKFPFITRELFTTSYESIREEITEAVKSFSNLFQGCIVVKIEEWMQYEIPDEKILLNGKLDCLMYDPADCEYILVDFKSTKNSIPQKLYLDPDDKAAIDFQMPVYLFLLEKDSNFNIKAENACFFNLKENKMVPVMGEKVFELAGKNHETKENIDEEIEYMKQCSLSLCSFMENAFDTQTAMESLNGQILCDCYNCDFKAICRKSFTVGKIDLGTQE